MKIVERRNTIEAMRTWAGKEGGRAIRAPRGMRERMGWNAAERMALMELVEAKTRAENTTNLRQRVAEKAKACIEARRFLSPRMMYPSLPMATNAAQIIFEKRLRALRRLRFKTVPLKNQKYVRISARRAGRGNRVKP
jgi:hypothetical protein